MRKIKKGDNVIVTTGRDKGRTGKVLFLAIKEKRLKIEGVNMVKKAVKPNPRLGKPGGMVEKEAFIHMSNVALLNPITQKADKIKIVVNAEGNKTRRYKSNDEIVDI
jgi:large subunit ribosomal protein L24